LKELTEGAYFSEVHLFSETTHTVSAAAGEISRLVVFAKPDFEVLVKKEPKLGNKALLKFLDFFGEKVDELYRENKELKHKLRINN
jgi:CRP-like cAMP-binding protein